MGHPAHDSGHVALQQFREGLPDAARAALYSGMPIGPVTWTVLKNDPIEKLGPNLWRVSGVMGPKGPQRSMAVARRADGDLVIYNAIALDEPGMAELEAFGRPAYMIVPNPFHRADAFIWKQRYPNLKVVAPAGAAKAAAKAVPVDMALADVPADPDIWLGSPDGFGEKEALMVVNGPDGRTAIACDALCNIPAARGFPVSVLMAPIGQLSTPRAIRWFLMKDGAAWASHLDRLQDGLTRLIPGHGDMLTGDEAIASLKSAAALLRS